MDVQSSRFHEALHGVSQHFTAGIVDVTFQFHHFILIPLSFPGIDEEGPEDIGPFFIVPFSGTKARLYDGKRSRQAVGRAEGCCNGCSRGGYILSLRFHDFQGHMAGGDDIQRSRNRHRKHAVLAADGAGAFRELRHNDIGNAKGLKAYGRCNDIYDGIDGSHFMEVDLFNGQVMGLRFRLRHDAENLLRQFPGGFRHVRTVDDRFHIRQMPVFMMVVMVVVMMVALFAMAVAVMLVPITFFLMAVAMVFVIMALLPVMAMAVMLVIMAFFPVMTMAVVVMILFPMMMFFCHRQGPIEIGHIVVMVFVFFVQDHIEIAAVDARLLHPGDFHGESFGRDGVQCLFQYLPIRPQVQKGCHKHVSRNAGRRFQI